MHAATSSTEKLAVNGLLVEQPRTSVDKICTDYSWSTLDGL